MIYVINSANKNEHREFLEEQFRIRHEIFVKEKGWHDFERAKKYEMDQYDDDETIYVVAVEEGHVIGGFRLYPTLLPHMLIEVFPHLLNEAAPRDAAIYEMTRIFIVRDRRDTGTWYTLVAALHEYCLVQGIRSITAVIPMFRLPILRSVGLIVRPMGLPQDVDGVPTISLQITIDPEALIRIRKSGKLAGPVLIPELALAEGATMH